MLNNNNSKSISPSQTDQNPEQFLGRKVSIFSLYKYCQTFEFSLLILGIITGAANGASLPLMCVVIGSAINGFKPTNTMDEVLAKVAEQALWMLWIGIISFGIGMISETCWSALGERLGIRVRTLYLEALLKRDVAWFDVNRPQELPTKITSLITRFQNGIGERVGKIILSISMFISGITVAFIYGWKLALAFLGLYPMTVFIARYAGTVSARGAESVRQGYAKCGGYAEEAFSAVKTVYAFCAEKFETNKYLNALSDAESSAIRSSTYLGISVGLISMLISLSQGVGFLIGSYFIQYSVYNTTFKEAYTTASVMTVFFSGIFAMFSLGMIAPQLKVIEEARIAAHDIYDVIVSFSNNTNQISLESVGLTISPDKFKGRIEFKNVTFAYPAKPDVQVLTNFSMVFEPGIITGICGETGSGKSTIIQLIEKFYKPCSGSIEVDGIDIQMLDTTWWRKTIGFVGQEPVLFNTSIYNNIKYGNFDATNDQIIFAAQQANAAEFIEKLPEKLMTCTGAGGCQLSGGQKQRIAIARALVKNPKIFLLDEATSALDCTSEAKVQEAIFGLQTKNSITAIIIAHRLTTIHNAGKIVVLSGGKAVETGTDFELRKNNGIYANLCRLQEGGDPVNLQELEMEEPAIKLEEVPVKIEEDKSSPRHFSSKPKSESSAKVSDLKLVERPSVAETAVSEIPKQIIKKEYTSRIWSENMKHKWHLIFGILLALIAGYNMPVSGTLFGMVSMDLLEPRKDVLRRKVNLDFIGFIINGIVILAITVCLFWLFGYVAAKVTFSLRERLYNQILKMDIGWFDLPANLPFILGNLLAEGAENINGVVRMIACSLIQSVSSVIIATVIGLSYSCRMTAIVLACVPLMAGSGTLQTKLQIKFAKEKDHLYEKSTEILSESVRNFRTVASFTNEIKTSEMYKEALELPLRKGQITAIIGGLLFGINQVLPFLTFALLFYLAALFLVKYEDDPRRTFIAVYALLFSAISLGQTQQYSQDMGKAYASLYRLYHILDQKPKIKNVEKPTENQIKGKIEFKNVWFKYPTRSDYVLKNLNFTIEIGQRVTIVGSSGSGKSTIVQLLERFYDVNEGEILIDGVNIKEYDITTLRKSLGYVSQEPYLFDSTIEENIKYGTPDASNSEIREACIISSALDFIEKVSLITENHKCITEGDLCTRTSNLETGFSRKVGTKGSLLSGGQKQRLAIARAILKKPLILLLDEATSALDSETEAEVQHAVSQAAEGRTTISVAHRLGAVGESDLIFVLDNGVIVEQGSKAELLNKNGCFSKLYGGATKHDKKEIVINN